MVSIKVTIPRMLLHTTQKSVPRDDRDTENEVRD